MSARPITDTLRLLDGGAFLSRSSDELAGLVRRVDGKVHFWYELIRPDRVHKAAAKELIERVRAGIGATPLLMGASS